MRGVPQDAAEAVQWYRLAAEQGLADAQYNLGVMYANGEGVPQDNVEAHMWLNLAASQFTGEQRERTVAARDRVAERMTPADLSEAQRRAREWHAAHQLPLTSSIARRAAGPATGSRPPSRRARSRSICVVNGRLRHEGDDAVRRAPPCVVSHVEFYVLQTSSERAALGALNVGLFICG